MPEFEIPSGNEFLDQDMGYESMLSFFEEALITSVDLGQNYIYSFNGMKIDNNFKGKGNSYTTEFRQYIPHLVRWLTIDPLAFSFPLQSPYAAFDNNPIFHKDPNGLASEGSWPGITFVFFEGEMGIGVGYGVQTIEQKGYAIDQVGETHFTMVNTVRVTGEEGEFRSGASISFSFNVKQSWRAETFTGYVKKSHEYNNKNFKADAAAGVGVGFTIGSEEFSIGISVGFEVQISVISTEITESISLTDKGAKKANDMYKGGLWTLGEKSGKKNDRGLYSAIVYVSTNSGSKSTGISVYSEDNKVWRSTEYAVQSLEAEQK